MKRKVIQIAGSTQLVSLPREWAKQQGIKKGDELEVNVQGDKIVVGKEGKENQFNRIELDVTNLGARVRKIVGAAYKGGYDEVKFNFSGGDELQHIQEILKSHCVGFEIVEQNPDYVIARKISDEIYGEFDAVLRRTFLTLLTMAKEGFDAIKNQQISRLRNVILMDSSVNKFTYFCRRVLNKRGYPDFKKTAPLYYIVDELEEVGDQYKLACHLILDNKLKLNKKLLEIHQEMNKQLEAFYELFYKFGLDKLVLFLEKKASLDAKIKRLLGKLSAIEHRLLFCMFTISEKLNEMDGPLVLLKYF